MAPDNGIAWFLRGRAHYALGRWTEAETDFQKAVLTDSDLIEARSGIGLVRAILGDTLGATKVFRDILKRDPDNSAARENLRRLGTIPSPPEPD
jgi:tetratricopeptide (TPR) repeat protein